MFGGSKPEVKKEPSIIEAMIRSGKTITSLTGDELWDLYQDTSVTSGLFLTVQFEISRRLKGV